MEEIKILEILTKKAEKYNVSFCGVESNAIIETVNEALSLHNVSQQSELLAFAKEMQNIGFNEIDNPEKVVDIYIKANCG
jgi:hypothetical protein